MWRELAYRSRHTSAFIWTVLGWKRRLIVPLWSPDDMLALSCKRLVFLCFQGSLVCLHSTMREKHHSRSFFTSCMPRCISLHMIGSVGEFTHMDFLEIYRYLQYQFWKDWLVSHRAPTCLPPRFSFNSWPRVKMAASHTGSLGSQSDQFSGSQETSASLSLSAALSKHLFGACGRGNRNGELRLVLLRFNHSLQRVSCFSLSRWQRGGKWSSTLPRLNSCTSDPDETDISLHLHCPSSSLAAHAGLFY